MAVQQENAFFAAMHAYRRVACCASPRAALALRFQKILSSQHFAEHPDILMRWKIVLCRGRTFFLEWSDIARRGLRDHCGWPHSVSKEGASLRRYSSFHRGFHCATFGRVFWSACRFCGDDNALKGQPNAVKAATDGSAHNDLQVLVLPYPTPCIEQEGEVKPAPPIIARNCHGRGHGDRVNSCGVRCGLEPAR